MVDGQRNSCAHHALSSSALPTASSVDKIGRAVQETLPEEDVSTGVRQRSRTQAGSNEPKHLALH